MKLRPYHWLADYYDHFFVAQRPIFRPARDGALAKILPTVKVACDIGCGTGASALELAREGIRMYGVDLSPGMCRAARKKVRTAKLPVKIIQGDMRDFKLPEPVDLVLCEFDALNHVPERSDLAAVARSVARALKPGGHFFFDINTRLAFEHIWPLTWWQEREGVVLVMHGGYDRDTDRAFSNVEWFFKEGELWRRRQEHVEEVTWSHREMQETLRDSGFESIRMWDATKFFKHEYIPQGCRRYYLARKSG